MDEIIKKLGQFPSIHPTQITIHPFHLKNIFTHKKLKTRSGIGFCVKTNTTTPPTTKK